MNIFKQLIEYLRKEENSSKSFDFITIGKRARDFVLRVNQNLVADFSENIGDPVQSGDSRSLVRFMVNAWNSGQYSKISIVYSHYVSAISQMPITKTIFPVNE